MEVNSNNNSQVSTSGSSVIDRASTTDAAVERKVEELLERASFEKRTKEIIAGYVDSVSFMKKVQEYASDEVKRCYSTDRYQDFQQAVVDIIHAELASDTGRGKLDSYVDARAGNVLDERGWKKKNFWWPIVVSSISALGAIAAVIIALVK